MNRTQNVIRSISEVGLFAAIGYVLDELQGVIGKGLFVNGGSIGFAMIAVIIVGIRRGWLPAVLCGLIIGLFDFSTGPYIIHPAQAILDYIIPYAVVGLALFLKPLYDRCERIGPKIFWLSLIVTIGGLLKLLTHYLAGVIFWADPSQFAWGLEWMNPYLYCFLYNFAFIGPSIVLCIVLIVVIQAKAPIILNQAKTAAALDEATIQRGIIYSWIVSGVLLVAGLALFITYAILFISSIETYSGDGYSGFEANGDRMVMLIIGFLMSLSGTILFSSCLFKKYSTVRTSLYPAIISLISFLYGLAMLIRAYVKGNPPNLYWIWAAVSLALLIDFTILTIYFIKLNKSKVDTISTN